MPSAPANPNLIPNPNPVTNPAAANKLVGLLTSSRLSSKYSDLRIVCGSRDFSVHQAIVCPQSEFFAALVYSEFLEATTRTVELHDDDPEDVERMVNFFYSTDYDTSVPTDCHLTYDARCLQAQLTNAAMYAMGEKYLIPEMKKLALLKFNSDPIGAACWIPGSGYSRTGLLDLVRLVYTSTPSRDRGLRDPMMAACVKYGRAVANILEDVLGEVPDAHVDYLKAKLATTESLLAAEKGEKEKCTKHAGELGKEIVALKRRNENSLTCRKREKAGFDKALHDMGANYSKVWEDKVRLETTNRQLRDAYAELQKEIVKLRASGEPATGTAAPHRLTKRTNSRPPPRPRSPARRPRSLLLLNS